MPPSEMTATSVVPPPMSTISEPGRLRHGQPGADRRRHRLLDQAGPAGAGVEGGVADGALLDLGHAGRDAEQHPRPRDQADPVVHLVHEVLDHLLGDVEVADDAVAERADRDDRGGRPADHPLGLGADGEDALGLGVDGDDRRLGDDDPAVADVDERVGRAEVDPDVAGEEAEESVEHAGGAVPCCGTAGPAVARRATAPAGRGEEGSGRPVRGCGGRARAVYRPPRDPSDAARSGRPPGDGSARGYATALPDPGTATYLRWPYLDRDW